MWNFQRISYKWDSTWIVIPIKYRINQQITAIWSDTAIPKMPKNLQNVSLLRKKCHKFQRSRTFNELFFLKNQIWLYLSVRRCLMHWKDWTFIFSNYVKVSVSAIVIVIVKVSVILEAWKMKFGRDATVIRLVGGIQAMEMQVMMSQ